MNQRKLIEPLEQRTLLSSITLPVPEAGVDYGPAIRDAIDQAIRGGGDATVQFQPGRYLVMPSPADWQFDTAGNAAGWTAGGAATSVSGGLLTATPSGGAAFDIDSPGTLNLKGSLLKYLQLAMKSTSAATQGRIWWQAQGDSGWDPAKSRSFSITPGILKQYTIALAGVPSWTNSIIKQVRIDIVESGAAGIVQIDSVHIGADSAGALVANDVVSRYAIDVDGVCGKPVKLVSLATSEDSPTTLLIGDPLCGAIRVNDSADVLFQGLRIDYQTPPWMQGTITAIDPIARSFDYQTEVGYGALFSDPRYPLLTDRWGIVADPANPALLKPAAPDAITISSWEDLGGGAYRLNSASTSGMAVGDKFVLVTRSTNFNTFAVANDDSVAVKDCSVYKGAQTAISAAGLKGLLSVDGFQLIRGEASQYISEPADGVHVQNLLWKPAGPGDPGPSVRDSSFEGMLDDAIAFYQVPGVITGRPSSTEITLDGSYIPQAGDEVMVLDANDGKVRGTATVASVSASSSSSASVTLATPILGMIAGGDRWSGDQVYNLSRNFQNWRITNSTFRDGRRYGVMSRAGQGLIEDCTFINLAGSGVALRNEISSVFNTGPMPDTVTIRGNRFDNVSYLPSMYNSGYFGAIQATGYRNYNRLSATRGVRNLTIQDNTIDHVYRAGINIGSADTVTFLGANRITGYAQDAIPADGIAAGVRLQNAANVSLGGVSVTDPRGEMDAGILIDSSCESVLVDADPARPNSFALAAGVPDVLDQRFPAPYVDHFESGKGEGWTQVSGRWSITPDGSSNDVLRQPDAAGEAIIHGGDASWTDYTAEASVAVTAIAPTATGAGLAFRFKDAQNYYWFNINPASGQLRLLRKLGGAWSTLGSASFPAIEGRTYRLRATAIGQSIQCFIDGELAFNITDDGVSSGGIGFRTYFSAATIDDVTVNRAWSMPFQEDFEDGNTGGWATSSGAWAVGTGGTRYLRQTGTGGAEALAIAGDAAWRDYTIEANVRDDAEGAGSFGAGILFRARDADNFYLFNIKPNSNELRLLKKVNGTYSSIAPNTAPPVALSIGAWYRLKAVLVGTSIRCYLDDALVFSATDGSIASGAVGLRTYSAAASLDDVKVSRIYAQDFEPGYLLNWTMPRGAWSLSNAVAAEYPPAAAQRVPGSGISGAGAEADGSKLSLAASALPLRLRKLGSAPAAGAGAIDQSRFYGEAVGLANTAAWNNYTVEARVRINVSGPTPLGAGIAFRYADADNYYWLSLNRVTGELKLTKKSGGAWTQLGSTAKVSAGAGWYALKAIAYGNSIRCFFGGQELISVLDATLSIGKVGLATSGVAASFDDLVVTEL